MTLVMRIKKRFYFVAAAYFRFFANHAFKRWNPRVIAITGSVGKTTMLHLTEFELGKKAHYSHDANSAFGISFDMVGVKGIKGSKLRWIYLILAVPIRSLFYKHKEPFYVVEIDGERPHEAEFLAKWLKPEVTLWVSFGLSHVVQFEQQIRDGVFDTLEEAIAHEFATLPNNTRRQVYIDKNVEMMRKATRGIRADITELDKNELKKYTLKAESTDFEFDDVKFHFAQPQPKDLAIQLLMLKNLVDYLHLDLKTDFTDMPVPPGRSSYFEGKKGIKIVDSSYNAHLISVQAILEMAKAMKSKHKWLVLGDIVDQGYIEGDEHAKLAQIITDVKPEQVVLVGRRTKKYTAPILKLNKVKHIACDDPKEALAFIEKHIKGNETLVFKGSQYLEWIIEKLLKNPEDAAKLPRREAAAVKRREKRGLN